LDLVIFNAGVHIGKLLRLEFRKPCIELAPNNFRQQKRNEMDKSEA
jgi:hypothetical protein